MPGDWMSVSMTLTRFPARATSTATLAVVFDFPVPPRNECVEMIFGKWYSPRRYGNSPNAPSVVGSGFRVLRPAPRWPGQFAACGIRCGSLCLQQLCSWFFPCRPEALRLLLQLLEQRSACDLVHLLLLAMFVHFQQRQCVRVDVVDGCVVAGSGQAGFKPKHGA